LCEAAVLEVRGGRLSLGSGGEGTVSNEIVAATLAIASGTALATTT